MGVGLIKNEDSSFTISTLATCNDREISSLDSIESHGTANHRAESKLLSDLRTTEESTVYSAKLKEFRKQINSR